MFGFLTSILILTFTTVLSVEIPFKEVLPVVSASIQQQEVKDLITRIIGEKNAGHFDVIVNNTIDFRSFQIKKLNNNKILITGYDGVSTAKGFHHYMKYAYRKQVSWIYAKVKLNISDDMLNLEITSKSQSPFIYYQNVCTWSYSFPWWDWSTWRVHIDWMALMGISLTIAPIQESIWYDVYRDLGLSEDEIHEHFAGPAFQAWQRMGNIKGWGSPLPATYRHMQMLLQKKIITAQRNLGITVALPAFAGHVPTSMKRLYPNVTFSLVNRWNSFSDRYCCPLFLDGNEPLFSTISGKFLKATISAFGSNHLYFADPFNEVQPREANVDYLKKTASNIFRSMRLVDHAAIWLLQGWMFVKNIYWTDDLIKAFLTAVPIGKMIILDLQSDQFPQYEKTYSFYGQPFIWCMLHNFGGTLGMHGSVNVINNGIRQARTFKNSSIIGVGIAPEGIYQNYVMYVLTLERAWYRDDFNLNQWFDEYSEICFGTKNASLQNGWQLLRQSVYSYYGLKVNHGKYVLTRRPSLNIDTWIWYNTTYIHEAWKLFLIGNDTVVGDSYVFYEHNLVDITRQFLQIMFEKLYVNLVAAYKNRQINRFVHICERFIKLFDDLEAILATQKQFLLGPWLESAKKMSSIYMEKRLYEINAREQITIWGPNAEILDYATKQWSGIIQDYYKPRWTLFFSILKQNLMSNTKFNDLKFKEMVFNDVENPFTTDTKLYPTTEIGNTFTISQQIFDEWSSYLVDYNFSIHVHLNIKQL